MDDALHLLTVCAALGSGLIAGVFFAFSTFVMRALAELPPAQGMAAMQAINRTVLNVWFLGAFIGTAVLCALLAVAALLRWQAPGAPLALGGALAYVIGTFLVTGLRNVPMNEALARLAPDAPDAPGHWAGYLARWTAWNHLRTAAALLGAALLTVSAA